MNVVMHLVRTNLPGAVAANQVHLEGLLGCIDPWKADSCGSEVGVVQGAARWVRAKRRRQTQKA